MRKGKKKYVTVNFNTNKKVVRETCGSYSPADRRRTVFFSYMNGFDLGMYEQTDPLDGGHHQIFKKVNFASNNDDSKPEESDDDLIDIANNFSAVKKIGPQIDKNLASIPK